MSTGQIRNDLHLANETVVIPHSSTPPNSGVVFVTRTILDGAYTPAQLAFGKAVQAYTDRLATEGANQEASERAPGATNTEITESAVIRAQQALDKKVALQVRKRTRLDPIALAGSPIFSGMAGVLGSFLHSPLQVGAFVASAVVAMACVVYLALRRVA